MKFQLKAVNGYESEEDTDKSNRMYYHTVVTGFYSVPQS